MTPAPARTILLLGADQHAGRQLASLADELRLTISDDATLAERPAAVVMDLGRYPDAVGELGRWRARHPDVIIAAYLAVPARDLWEAAERAGADLVVNRGALVRALRRLLVDLGGASARRKRFPLFDAAEVAGRLGLVQAVDDTPVGPVAVFRLGAGLVAVENRCPHAGAALSAGPVDDGVVTCPAHGSRFALTDGERVRGPADSGLRVFSVVEQEGRVWLLWV